MLDINHRISGQAPRVGPPADESVPPLDQTAGVEPWETEHFSDAHERAGNPIFCMIRFWVGDSGRLLMQHTVANAQIGA